MRTRRIKFAAKNAAVEINSIALASTLSFTGNSKKKQLKIASRVQLSF